MGLKQVEKDNNLTQIQIGRLSFLEEPIGFIKPFYGKEIYEVIVVSRSKDTARIWIVYRAQKYGPYYP